MTVTFTFPAPSQAAEKAQQMIDAMVMELMVGRMRAEEAMVLAYFHGDELLARLCARIDPDWHVLVYARDMQGIERLVMVGTREECIAAGWNVDAPDVVWGD